MVHLACDAVVVVLLADPRCYRRHQMCVLAVVAFPCWKKRTVSVTSYFRPLTLQRMTMEVFAWNDEKTKRVVWLRNCFHWEAIGWSKRPRRRR